MSLLEKCVANDSATKKIALHLRCKMLLPTIDSQKAMSLKDRSYLDLLNPNIKYTRAELETLLKLSKDSLIRILNRFLAEGLLKKEGNGRATKYYLE